MTTTTFPSREFNQYASKVKMAANQGPVFITDRGRPVYVLLTIEDDRELTAPTEATAKLSAMPGDFERTIPPRRDRPKAAELN